MTSLWDQRDKNYCNRDLGWNRREIKCCR